MASDPDFIDHCLELLAVLGPARARRMFGGHGLYADGLFVAIVVDNVLYLKADAAARPSFEASGCRPFEYPTADGRRVGMAYWSAPEVAMDSPAGMAPWGRLALASALRAAASKPAASARKASASARQAPEPTPAAASPAPRTARRARRAG